MGTLVTLGKVNPIVNPEKKCQGTSAPSVEEALSSSAPEMACADGVYPFKMVTSSIFASLPAWGSRIF